MKVSDEEWDTSHFSYMTDKQIVEVHQHIYNQLIEGIKKLRSGDSIGDIFVPLMIKKLLIETNKRFKGVKSN